MPNIGSQGCVMPVERAIVNRGAIHIVWLLVMTASILGPSCSGVSGAAQPFSSLIPADTVLYLSTPDASTLQTQWNATRLSEFWDDKRAAPFASEFRKTTRLTPKCDVPLLGISWEEVVQLASGEVCFALFSTKENQTGYLLLVDATQNQEAAETFLQALPKQFSSDNSIRHSTKNIAKNAVQVFQIPTAQETEAFERFFFHRDGVLGVTNQEEMAQTLLQQLAARTTNGLGNSKAYRTIVNRCQSGSDDPAPHLTWYLDPWRFFSLARQGRETTPTDTITLAKQQGLDIIRAVGGTATLAPDGYDVQYKWFAYAEGSRKGAARMLELSPVADAHLPGIVPADINEVRIVGWDLRRVLEGYGSWFDANWAEGVDGTFDAVLDDIRDEEGGPQVDLRGLLGMQKGPVIEIAADIFTSDGLESHVAYAVKLGDAQKAADAVERMFVTDPEVAQRTVEDSTAWVFYSRLELGDDEMRLPGPDLSGWAFSVSHDYLFAATNIGLLEHMLKGPRPQAILGDDKYEKIWPSLVELRPDDCVAWELTVLPNVAQLGYGQWGQWGQTVIDSLAPNRQSSADKPSPKDLEQKRPTLGRPISLPPSDVAEEFLTPRFGFLREYDDGWLYNGFSTAPEGASTK